MARRTVVDPAFAGTLAELRARAGLSLSQAAAVCHVTRGHISNLERGVKSPTEATARALDTGLRAGGRLAALVTEVEPDRPAGTVHQVLRASQPPTGDPTASLVANALLVGRAFSRSAVAGEAAQLGERVEHAWRMWQSSPQRFTRAAEILPSLIADIEHARLTSHACDAVERRQVLRAAADLYGLLRSYYRRTGRLDLSLVAADRAIRAAQDADDPLRVAAAHWNLGHVLLSYSEPDAIEKAKEVALLAIEEVCTTPSTIETKAVEGALELVAVISDARQGRRQQARQRLEQRALPLAKYTGERNVQWTAFGPTNVDLHALSVEMLAGSTADGLRLADRVEIDRVPSRERQFTFTLEVSRCYDLQHDDAAVLLHLLNLKQAAPEDLARSGLARDMTDRLHRRVRPTLRRQVNELTEYLRSYEGSPP